MRHGAAMALGFLFWERRASRRARGSGVETRDGWCERTCVSVRTDCFRVFPFVVAQEPQKARPRVRWSRPHR